MRNKNHIIPNKQRQEDIRVFDDSHTRATQIQIYVREDTKYFVYNKLFILKPCPGLKSTPQSVESVFEDNLHGTRSAWNTIAQSHMTGAVEDPEVRQALRSSCQCTSCGRRHGRSPWTSCTLSLLHIGGLQT